ncbi:MAG: hypothetical protein JRI23_34960 [Deltaproteobacteria bacterium]|jgi:predicted CxxxxCH...CXXCH cytochrome family protein|nr:hypothetical protein [Deltaproteobacteria bacterium]MBW2537508.1 hypothetical protein [Deltaproteobacteria bacterium]
MNLTKWIALLGAVGAAVGGTLLGCETVLLNDYPGGEGWGPGAGAATTTATGSGGGGGGTSTGTGEGGNCGINPCYCYECHGDPANLNTAPPPDIDANTDTSLPSVGAHQAHMQPSDWHVTHTCEQCHFVPVSAGFDPNVPTHLNNETDVDWGSLASGGGMTPDDYDFTGRTCTNTYCHAAYAAGAGGGGSAEAVPIWNQVDGTFSACGSACHLNPTPTINHLATDTDCERSGCHSGVMSLYDTANPDQSTWVDQTLHMNGVVDFD